MINSHQQLPTPGCKLFEIYQQVKYLSLKHDSYFQVYEELFSNYLGKEITFVEIGVLDGGSLHMWRKFFGAKARIIGIDLNPCAKKLQEDGFEIVIGSQADPTFWDKFFAEVGSVDVILDDGGHTNTQQIMTAHKCIPHIKDGGMLVVEDIHTSYFREFGNPSPYSFINYAKRMVDAINSRCPEVNSLKNNYTHKVYSISFYESMVCFRIDEKKSFISKQTTNHGVSANVKDYRNRGSMRRLFYKGKSIFNRLPFFNRISQPIFSFLIRISYKRESAKLKHLFK